jgi:uncharacterized protein (DUF2384 family)
MFTTEKPRKQRQTSKPKNIRRDRKSGLSVKLTLETNPYQDCERRLKTLEEEQEKLFQMLQQIIETYQKSTANSLSLQDLEQDPGYKYGVCITRLKDLFNTDRDVEEWLNSHESGLPQTPLQYLEEGKFEVVEGLIGMIEYGIPS